MIDFSDLLILMVVVWTIGKVFRAFKLPMVFGELLGGVIVGPILLNLVDPNSELIKIIAELGVFFLMLHSGLETDPKELLQSSKKSFLIGIGGVILPFLSAFYLAQTFGQSVEASFFLGIGASVSSIPITARIFKDCKIQKTKVGHIAMGSAIFEDIIALILFSVVLNIAEVGTVDTLQLLKLIGTIVAFFGIVIWGGMKISPFMNRIIYFNNKGFTVTLIIALLMGLIAEAIGLHMIIGAFLAGLFIREEVIDSKTFTKIEDRIYGLSYGFFGPIFFASLAFHLDFSALKVMPVFFIAIMAVAILGKIIGSGGIARLLGMNPKESLLIGLAMNNRGAIELIIASIGLELGIIDVPVFSIMVMMAFITTVVSVFSIPPLAKKLTEKTASGLSLP